MDLINNCRRRACLVLLAILAAAPVAWAQDPQSAMVQKTAREWLVMADKDDGTGSWKAGGKKFQNAIPGDKWGQALADVHAGMGKVLQRAIIGTTFDKSFAGAPDGEYATVEFRTAFEGRSDGRETITLEREADGVWRVIGYSIH